MICYLCAKGIPDDQPFYNDYGKQVCKPCFKDAPRCFVCRFPGKGLQQVEGLGWECEFCRGKMIGPEMPLAPLLEPLAAYLAPFGVKAPADLRHQWTARRALRGLQSDADLPNEEFIDDFLQYCYPVYYQRGALHLLPRMTKPTFMVYAIVQLAAAHVATEFGQPDLGGKTPFHTFARGWCHWLGYEAALRLGYDLERRQLRKWPELGAQGEFQRWQAMAEFNTAGQIVKHFRASLPALARKHLATETLPRHSNPTAGRP